MFDATRPQLEAWQSFNLYKALIEVPTFHAAKLNTPSAPTERYKELLIPAVVDRFLVEHPEHKDCRAHLIASQGGENKSLKVRVTYQA